MIVSIYDNQAHGGLAGAVRLVAPPAVEYPSDVQDDQLRQLLYHSQAVGRPDTSDVLASSKRNNGMDGITGILFFDGQTYIQVLEGAANSVEAAFARICTDPRHTDVTVISNHQVDQRDFSYWSMELRDPANASDDASWRLRRRLEQFAPELHHYFFDGNDQA